MDLLFTVKTEEEKQNYGLFSIEPLVQGYGQTLGTSIRRVLLTSLPGAAITQVKIEKVRHPFSTIPGVKEDVVELMLNLKKVRVAYVGEGPVKLTLDKKGPGVIRAGDIKTPGNVKIVNPDLHIATLADTKSSFSGEFTVDTGTGYSFADERKTGTLGVIILDAIYTPITRVNYKVEATRVGRLTNYDKLILEVWTDGTIKPSDAIRNSAEILRSYYSQVISPTVAQEEAREPARVAIPSTIASLSVEELNIPARVANALVAGGYETVGDLLAARHDDLLHVRNLGEKSLKIVSAALGEHGVQFTTSQ